MTERTLVLVKPDGVGRKLIGEVLSRIERKGLDVVAMDLRTAFAADKLSPDVGKRYRDLVLGQGAQKPAPELVKDFLGRESNSQAFFEYLKK